MEIYSKVMDNHIFKILEILGPIAESNNPIVDYNHVLEKSGLSEAYLDDAIGYLEKENAIVFTALMGSSKGLIQDYQLEI